MEPYWSDGTVTLYHGDCREILPCLPPCSADLLLTDPPYGQEYKSGWGSHALIAGDDGSLDMAAVLTQACEVLRRGRHAYIFGPAVLNGTPLTTAAELIWDKGITGMGDLSLPWAPSHELITFATYEPSKANRAKGSGRLSARMRQGSVLRVQRAHSGGSLLHPTEKPVELLRQLIESSSCLGETVLDPFAGVGSTLVAAALEGRRAIGIEIEDRYCETAVKRLAQGRLFDDQ